MEVADRAATPPSPPSPPTPAPNWRGLAQPVGVAALAAAGCAYVALMNPNESSVYPQCPFRAMTGLDCPGCGLTRSVYALLHGDVARAVDHNVLVVLLVPLAVLGFVKWTAGRLGYQGPRLPRYRPWMSVALGVVLFGFLVVRNLPGLDFLRATAG